jgi:hypothetical protein
MGDLYKGKKPNEMTAEEITAIRDANSTKAKMGEGKPPSPIKAGVKLYEGLKNIVKDSMARTIQTKEQNKVNYEKTKKKD